MFIKRCEAFPAVCSVGFGLFSSTSFSETTQNPFRGEWTGRLPFLEKKKKQGRVDG